MFKYKKLYLAEKAKSEKLEAENKYLKDKLTATEKKYNDMWEHAADIEAELSRFQVSASESCKKKVAAMREKTKGEAKANANKK